MTSEYNRSNKSNVKISLASILIANFALSQAEARAEFAERSVQKLQKEVDRLEGTYGYYAVKMSSLIAENMSPMITVKVVGVNVKISIAVEASVAKYFTDVNSVDCFRFLF